MTAFQRLVIRALMILINMQLSPRKAEGQTVEEYLNERDATWRNQTYPNIAAWNDEAQAALDQPEKISK